MNDREFVREVGPWGFAVTGVAMLGIFLSRVSGGLEVLPSFGYTFFALPSVPFAWLVSGRYASYWLSKGSGRQVVRAAFVVCWILITAKLCFLGWPELFSPMSILFVALSALFSGYAAARSFGRVASREIEALRDPSMPPWLMHPILVIALVIFFVV